MKTTLEKTNRVTFNLILPPRPDEHWVSEALKEQAECVCCNMEQKLCDEAGLIHDNISEHDGFPCNELLTQLAYLFRLDCLIEAAYISQSGPGPCYWYTHLLHGTPPKVLNYLT